MEAFRNGTALPHWMGATELQLGGIPLLGHTQTPSTHLPLHLTGSQGGRGGGSGPTPPQLGQIRLLLQAQMGRSEGSRKQRWGAHFLVASLSHTLLSLSQLGGRPEVLHLQNACRPKKNKIKNMSCMTAVHDTVTNTVSNFKKKTKNL